MQTIPTMRAPLARLSGDPAAREYPATRWMVYWVVGSLVTIYLWTAKALRDSVGNRIWSGVSWQSWHPSLSGASRRRGT
jgi:hypothetical protein